MVNATVPQLAGSAAEEVSVALRSSTSFNLRMVQSVSTLEGIHAVTTGPITVTDVGTDCGESSVSRLHFWRQICAVAAVCLILLSVLGCFLCGRGRSHRKEGYQPANPGPSEEAEDGQDGKGAADTRSLHWTSTPPAGGRNSLPPGSARALVPKSKAKARAKFRPSLGQLDPDGTALSKVGSEMSIEPGESSPSSSVAASSRRGSRTRVAQQVQATAPSEDELPGGRPSLTLAPKSTSRDRAALPPTLPVGPTAGSGMLARMGAFSSSKSSVPEATQASGMELPVRTTSVASSAQGGGVEAQPSFGSELLHSRGMGGSGASTPPEAPGGPRGEVGTPKSTGSSLFGIGGGPGASRDFDFPE